MADVLSQGEYTGETLRDLANFLDREEAVSSVDAFTHAIGEWLGGRRELTEPEAEIASRTAADVWQDVDAEVSKPRSAIHLDEDTLQDAAGAMVYYVNAWNLPLNPEDLEEIAYAILAHLGAEPSNAAAAPPDG
jgi:hypothetical protein